VTAWSETAADDASVAVVPPRSVRVSPIPAVPASP
jgi:hypothetical protein